MSVSPSFFLISACVRALEMEMEMEIADEVRFTIYIHYPFYQDDDENNHLAE